MKEIRKQESDFNQILKYLRAARKKVEMAVKILDIGEEAAFQVAYEAMIKASIGLMLSYGIRPRIGPNYHKNVIKFAGKILGNKFASLIRTFDYMRRKRNRFIYEVDTIISQKEAEDSIKIAKKYLDIIDHIIQKKNPQKKLI